MKALNGLQLADKRLVVVPFSINSAYSGVGQRLVRSAVAPCYYPPPDGADATLRLRRATTPTLRPRKVTIPNGRSSVSSNGCFEAAKVTLKAGEPG